MKPFDLKKALAGHPLVTRDGQKVTGFGVSQSTDYPYQARVLVCSGESIAQTFTASGQYCMALGKTQWDLFLADPKPAKHAYKNFGKKGVKA